VAVELHLSKRFLKVLDGANDSDRARVESALLQLGAQWGAPHAHAGLSIRRIQANFFECRAGLYLRIVFRVTPGGLDLIMFGDHDAVRQLLRGI
jgi:hypothetical protein